MFCLHNKKNKITLKGKHGGLVLEHRALNQEVLG